MVGGINSQILIWPYFDTFINEYNKVKASMVEESQVPNGETKEFLEQMLIQCQTEIDKLGS